MQDVHTERSSGWSGLAFVVVVALGVVAQGVTRPPDAVAPNGAVAAYMQAHRAGLLLGAWMAFPMTAFFLWFVSGMRGLLRQASPKDDGLPAYALGGAVLALAAQLIATLLLAAVALHPPFAGASSLVWTMASLAGTPLTCIGVAIFTYACAHSMRRHASGPPWLVTLGYLASLGAAVSTLSLFFGRGPLSANGWVPLLLGAVLFLIWTAAASIRLLQAPADSAAFASR